MASAESLRKLAETDVTVELPQEQFVPVITSPPFVLVDGTFNTRDIGQIPNSPLRPGFVYRSGALSRVTDSGKDQIAGKLGVKRVFDLRTAEEREASPDPLIASVENSWVPEGGPEHVDVNDFREGTGEEAYAIMYMESFEVYQESWKAVLEHVRDRPQDPILIHCTAGRDRTGILAGLLLSLAGADNDTVVLDYILSRVGSEPARPMLLAIAVELSGAKSVDHPGFHNLVSLRATNWNAFVGAVDKKYGGFEKFVTDKLGFSDEDLARIKLNLTQAP